MSKDKKANDTAEMTVEPEQTDREVTQEVPTGETDANIDTSAEEIEEIEEMDEVTALKNELAALKDDHLRLMAEYDNYRKRTLKEKSDLIKYGGEKIVVSFLDIMDDFELALENISKTKSVEGLAEGVELIQSKFISTLKAQGVNKMDVIGEDFDADQHEAVAMVPTDDNDKKGKVIDCVQTGYTLNDKVIRHPKVVVGN